VGMGRCAYLKEIEVKYEIYCVSFCLYFILILIFYILVMRVFSVVLVLFYCILGLCGCVCYLVYEDVLCCECVCVSEQYHFYLFIKS
jgi:hypothetical protein